MPPLSDPYSVQQHADAEYATAGRRVCHHDSVTDPPTSAPSGIPDAKRVIEILTAVIAPVTALTALLGYVGWIRSGAYFSYFGIDPGLLNLSIQDYVLRSTDVAFGAVARLLAALVVLALLDRLLARVQRATDLNGDPPQTATPRPRRLAQALVIIGLALSLAGLLLALGLGAGRDLPALLGPALLGVGSVVTFRLSRALVPAAPESRSLRQASAAALVIALALALFWAATLYAQELGHQAAAAIDNGSTRLPVVTVYSATFLDLPGARVEATKFTGPEGTASFRYTGLLLLSYTNGRWLLISGTHSASYHSSVVVVRDAETIRVEVSAPA
ncbi:MAG: hypothetical protein JO115_16435 [Pseudonocardiales bacterium]|nr:hypothetical protein [Pseudonocardiales bacterium]